MNGVAKDSNGQANGVQKRLTQLQIIDENQNFTCVYYTLYKSCCSFCVILSKLFICCNFNRQELSTCMKDEWNLADSGFNYNLVAVFGSQSTGKSKYNLFLLISFDIISHY